MQKQKIKLRLTDCSVISAAKHGPQIIKNIKDQLRKELDELKTQIILFKNRKEPYLGVSDADPLGT